MPPPPAESRATTAGKWLLALVVPGAAQALGSVPTEARVLMSAVAALITAARNLITSTDIDQANKQVFMACEVLEQAQLLANNIASDCLDAIPTKRAAT